MKLEGKVALVTGGGRGLGRAYVLHLAARSRAGLLRGGDRSQPAFADLQNWCMIRLGEHKLTVEDDDCRPTLLFDVEADPYELSNLADSPAHASVVADLRGRLCHWRDECLQFRASLPNFGN